MLRAITRQKIFEIVENSYFGFENYTVQFGEQNTDMAFVVRFLANKSFEFRVERWAGSHFKTTETPGEQFLAADEATFDGLDIVFEQLVRWLERIHQEIIATNPFNREIIELRAQLDERLASLGEEQAGYFTKAEAGELIERLNEFERRLNSLASENTELSGAVEILSKTIEDLKDAADSINRGTWFRMAGGRLLGGLKSLAKSKDARDFALEAAKKFLLEGPK